MGWKIKTLKRRSTRFFTIAGKSKGQWVYGVGGKKKKKGVLRRRGKAEKRGRIKVTVKRNLFLGSSGKLF